jgi:hypothetical protein
MKLKAFLTAVAVVQLFVGAQALIKNATENSDEYRAVLQSLEDTSDDPDDFEYPGFVKFGAYRKFPAIFWMFSLIFSSQEASILLVKDTTSSTGIQGSTERLGRKQKSFATTLGCSSSHLTRKTSLLFSFDSSPPNLFYSTITLT